MKTKLFFICMLFFSTVNSFGQTVGTRFTLPYYEGFNYDEGTKLLTEAAIVGQGGWQTFNANAVAGSGSNPIIVADPGWNMGGLPIPTYNALNIWSSGDDPVINFTDQGSKFTIYSSFVFRVATPTTDYWTDTTGEYFYSFGKTSTTNGVNYTSNVYLKKTTANGTSFNIGIAETNTTAANMLVWSSGSYNYDQDIVIVIKYQIDDANPTGLATLWINPVIGSTEPVANANTASDVTTAARTGLDKIRILKSAQTKTPNIIMDEIRVANTWTEVTGGTLGVAKQNIENLKIYPNPIDNGKLYISSNSDSEKQLTIYGILGQKVLDTTTNNNSEINVSNLAKGSYIIKITEEGKSQSKKILIQ